MRSKSISKVLLWGCAGLGLLAAGVFGYRQSATESAKEVAQKEEKPLWVSATPVPKEIDTGAYLAALNAVFDEDIEKAADFYLKVLKGDPNNPTIQKEAYLLNAMLGNFEALRKVTTEIANNDKAGFYTDYTRLAYTVKDKKWDDALQILANRHPSPKEARTESLLKAWIYAAKQEYNESIRILDEMATQFGASFAYYYHKGLIALMAGDEVIADESFQKIAQNELLSVSFYPQIRAFYVSKGLWGLENPFFIQWQVFSASQPATAELLMLAGDKPITPEKGMAEVFYGLSTGQTVTQAGFESSLILNALSLYINPNQDLPKIWSAEILEKIQKPQLASYYYKKMNGPRTQTLEFKKAMNLLACGQEKQAHALLQQLKQTNQNSTPLWMSLASIYVAQKNWPAAIQAYTHILEIADKSDKAFLSEVYFARSFIYIEQNESTKAKTDLYQAIEMNPKNPILLNHLGYMLLEKGEELEKAFYFIEKAYQIKPNDPHILDSMAYAHLKKGNKAKALPFAERAVDRMPQSSVTNMHLGEIYESLGRFREAGYQYDKALALKYDMTPALKEEILQKMAKNKVLSKKVNTDNH